MSTKQTSLSAYFTTSSSCGSSLQDTSTSQPDTETSSSDEGSGEEDQESSDTHSLFCNLIGQFVLCMVEYYL